MNSNLETNRSLALVATELLREFESPTRFSKFNSRLVKVSASKGLDRRQEVSLTSLLFSGGLRELRLKWPNSAPLAQIYCSRPDDDIHPLEVAVALFEGTYLCYQSALYWNGLTEQVPNNLYVAKERPKTSSRSKAPAQWDDFQLRDAFVKGPPEHKKVAVFRESKIFVLERASSDRAGVDVIPVALNGRTIDLPLTGRERTLVDCSSVPENAGGISNVIAAFETVGKSIDLDKLHFLYQAMHFKYPHWQRIGFILHYYVDKELSGTWMRRFAPPKNKFFLSKGYSADWSFDPAFSLFYPPGLIR